MLTQRNRIATNSRLDERSRRGCGENLGAGGSKKKLSNHFDACAGPKGAPVAGASLEKNTTSREEARRGRLQIKPFERVWSSGEIIDLLKNWR